MYVILNSGTPLVGFYLEDEAIEYVRIHIELDLDDIKLVDVL